MANTPPPPSRDSNRVPSPSTPTPLAERRATPPAFSSPLANRFSPQPAKELNPQDLKSKTPLTDSFHHQGVTTPPPPPPSSVTDGKKALGSPYQIVNGSTEALHGTQSPDMATAPMLYKQNNKTESPVSQFNTPPGPPVFSSPLRPAAAPFSPMPASLQPGTAHFSEIPFASPTRPGVLLPTSSSPAVYSNGTSEPQSNLSDDSDSSSLVAASPYVLFSARKEGSSQARYFVSRLIPAHKDPPYEQEARFPQLRSLTPEQRAKLKSSFLHFDDLSLCEWMRSMKLVPPEPS